MIKCNKTLFCTFVDYQKAFDLINRDELWFKLLKFGVSTKMLEIIKSMYTSVKLCIKHQSSLSDFFENNAGVKQGEPLSPFLFLMFINDLFECLKNDQEINIDGLSIILLLFADDLVLIAKSAKDMQMLLNKMHSYCIEWKC